MSTYFYCENQITGEKSDTVAIIRNAATGNLFILNGGTEYMVPRKRPRLYREVMNGPKFIPTINRPVTTKNTTRSHADLTERSPAAIGK